MAFRVCKMVRASSTSKYEYSDEDDRIDGEAAVARVKKALRWRDDATEAAWMERQQVSLLLCAICLNDRPAVRTLLGWPDAARALEMYTRPMWSAKEKVAVPHRAEPFATLCMVPFGHLSPTCAAVAYASSDVLQMVLAAKPPPPLLLSGKDHNDSWFLPLSIGDMRPYEQLVAAYPPSEYGELFGKPMAGFTWLVTAMFCLGPNQSPMLELCLANGMGRQVNVASMGMPPLIAAVIANPEVGIGTLKRLVELGADVNQRDRVPRSMRALSSTQAAFGVRQMRGLRSFFDEFDHGGTPLHHAVRAGNVAACKALVELGADVDAKDRKGARPVEVARLVHSASKTEELLVAALSGVEPSSNR